MLRYFLSEECQAHVPCVDEQCRARALVWIDQTKAYFDISLRSWIAIHFIAVQEVLAAHTMVIFYDKVRGYVEGCAALVSCLVIPGKSIEAKFLPHVL